MYVEESKTILVLPPRVGGTSMLRSLNGIPHSDRPFHKSELLYPNGVRHPKLSDMLAMLDSKPIERVVVGVRNPVDRYNSIKRFIIRKKQPDFSKQTNVIPGLVIHLLYLGYDNLIDVDLGVPIELIRQESFAKDFKKMFGRNIGGRSNRTKKAIPQPELCKKELDLIKKLNPFEAELYGYLD